MGIVNVTPDSFSDGGRYLRPARGDRARAGARRRGGGDPRRGRRVDAARGDAGRAGEELRRVIAVIEGLVAAGVGATISIDTSKAEVARAALDGRRRLRQRRDRLPRRTGDGGAGRGARRRVLPDAHAGRAAHDAGRSRATATSSPRSRRSCASASTSRWPPGSSGSGSWSTRASASARRWRTTSSCSTASTSSRRSGSRSWSAPRESRFSAPLTGRREHDRLAATIATNVIGLLRGASVFRVHDVAAVRDALAVAAATVSPR